MESLRGRVVCITSVKGIHPLIARHFAAQGARIVISAPDVDALERLHGDLVKEGVDVLAFPCDATDEASVRELVEMAMLWCGRVDALVVNGSTDEALRSTLVHSLGLPHAP